MEGWQHVPICRKLKEATGLPSFVEADTVAAAHGERLYGLGAQFRDFFYLYFGVGLGGCAICDGQVVRGAWGNAGEIGHVPLVPDGDPCPCGNRGCLERYISLEAYDRRTAEISEAAWLEEIAPILHSAIVMIENMLDPETIIVGGLAPRDLIEKLTALGDNLPNSIAARRGRETPRFVASNSDTDAVLRGAAALAVSGMLSPLSRWGMGAGGDGSSEDRIMTSRQGAV